MMVLMLRMGLKQSLFKVLLLENVNEVMGCYSTLLTQRRYIGLQITSWMKAAVHLQPLILNVMKGCLLVCTMALLTSELSCFLRACQLFGHAHVAHVL